MESTMNMQQGREAPMKPMAVMQIIFMTYTLSATASLLLFCEHMGSIYVTAILKL